MGMLSAEDVWRLDWKSAVLPYEECSLHMEKKKCEGESECCEKAVTRWDMLQEDLHLLKIFSSYKTPQLALPSSGSIKCLNFVSPTILLFSQILSSDFICRDDRKIFCLWHRSTKNTKIRVEKVLRGGFIL